MPIEALPETTTRALGSSLVLNDAKSVIKELVDNALDARATTISIEISANTLDIIQVKDNGTGINVQDRQLLCKRGCTSKIRTIEDLSRLGGTFLGFRGEAMASIVELSQAVVVTTCVDGETVGTSIKYAPSGLISSSSASHSVGTTIRVQNFLTRIPVRKQTALKETTKTLLAIKSLLFSFAFARPTVRFSLKVLKGKTDRFNWSYAGTPTSSLTDVATKIVGKDIASDLAAYTVTSDDCNVNVGDGWNASALLVSVTADPLKIRNTTQYISLDGRPVSTEHGTMKEIVKLYKHHVKNSVLSSTGSSVSRPFLFMQIRCPPEAYDINIEPSKDQVVFLKPRGDELLSLMKCLFDRAYPQKDDNQEEEDQENANQTLSPRASSEVRSDLPGSSLSSTSDVRSDFLGSGLSSVSVESSSELHDIMDFEHRKKAVIAHQRRLGAKLQPGSLRDAAMRSVQPRSSSVSASDSADGLSRQESIIEDYDAKFGGGEQSTLSQSSSNPHRNRYLKALQGLSHSHPESEDLPPVSNAESSESQIARTEAAVERPQFASTNARASPMDQQLNPLRGRLHHTKSSKLPLERIFPHSATFELTLTVDTFKELFNIRKQVQVLSSCDPYITKCTRAHYRDADLSDEKNVSSMIQDRESTLRKLVETKFPAQTEEESELIANLKFEISRSP